MWDREYEDNIRQLNHMSKYLFGGAVFGFLILTNLIQAGDGSYSAFFGTIMGAGCGAIFMWIADHTRTQFQFIAITIICTGIDAIFGDWSDDRLTFGFAVGIILGLAYALNTDIRGLPKASEAIYKFNSEKFTSETLEIFYDMICDPKNFDPMMDRIRWFKYQSLWACSQFKSFPERELSKLWRNLGEWSPMCYSDLGNFHLRHCRDRRRGTVDTAFDTILFDEYPTIDQMTCHYTAPPKVPIKSDNAFFANERKIIAYALFPQTFTIDEAKDFTAKMKEISQHKEKLLQKIENPDIIDFYHNPDLYNPLKGRDYNGEILMELMAFSCGNEAYNYLRERHPEIDVFHKLFNARCSLIVADKDGLANTLNEHLSRIKAELDYQDYVDEADLIINSLLKNIKTSQ